MMNNTILVKTFADLRNLVPPESSIPIGDGDTVGSVMDHMGIPEEKAAIIFINNRHADKDSPVAAGDRLSIFPPIGGG